MFGWEFTYVAGHGLEDLTQFLAAYEVLILGVEVNEAFGAHELALAIDVDLIVWHPFSLDTRPGLDFFGPLLQGCWVHELMLVRAQQEKAIFVVRSHLLWGEGIHAGE